MGFGKDGKGVIFRQADIITLLTLASEAALKQDNVPAVTDSLRIIKSEGVAKIQSATFVEGDGPVLLYLVDDDLSVAEIAAVISSAVGQPLHRSDIVGDELALRPVFYLATIPVITGSGESGANIVEWNRKIRWTFGEDSGFAIVAWNMGSGALDTGAIVRFIHTAYGVWVGA